MNPLAHAGVQVPPKVVTVQLAKFTLALLGVPQSPENTTAGMISFAYAVTFQVHIAYLSVTAPIMPTRWVFGGRRHCCLIYAHCVSPGGGGGYVGYIRKARENGYLEHLGSACCTDNMFRPFWTLPVLLAACFCQQAATMSAYKFAPRAVASPDAPQKPLVRKRARSGGARWVQVHQPGSRAKGAHTTKSQQPACTHKEHQILTSAEATAFAAHILDGKVNPTKAPQQEFLATCNHVDLEKNVKHAQWTSTPEWGPSLCGEGQR